MVSLNSSLTSNKEEEKGHPSRRGGDQNAVGLGGLEYRGSSFVLRVEGVRCANGGWEWVVRAEGVRFSCLGLSCVSGGDQNRAQG